MPERNFGGRTMNSVRKPFLSLAAFAALAVSLIGSSAADVPVADPVAVVNDFHNALNRGDASAAAALLDDKALIFEEGDAERSRAEYAAHHLAADIAFLAHVEERVLKRDSGFNGTFAWVATEAEMTGQVGDKTIDRFTTETMILHRVGGSWRILHIHWSSRPAEKK